MQILIEKCKGWNKFDYQNPSFLLKGLYNFSESINEKLVNCAYNALIDLKNAVNRK